MENRLYIEPEEEITSIVSKVRRAAEGELFLIVPKGASVAQSLVNLKLLDKEAARSGKRVVFVSTDPQVRKLAAKAGLLVKSSLSSYQEGKVQALPFSKAENPRKVTLSPKGKQLREEIKRAIDEPQKAVKEDVNNQTRKLEVGAFDISSRAPKKPPEEKKEKEVKEEAINPFSVKPLEDDEEKVETPPVPEKTAEIIPVEPEMPVKPEIPAEQPLPEERFEDDALKRGVVRAKMSKDRPGLDLMHSERKVEDNKPMVERTGIVETTRRKVGGASKVVDLRSVPRDYFPETPGLKVVKKKKEKKDIVLLPLFNTKLFFVFLLGITIILGIVGGVILPSAKVEIKPRDFVTEAEVKTAVSEEVGEIDWEEKIIPGKSIRFKINESRAFSASSEREVQSKAKGRVTVYNQSEEPINIKNNARLTSKDGKSYYTTSAILVPGAEAEEGTTELKPGSFSVEVAAGEAGEDNNVQSGKLTFPGLGDTDFADSVYAEIGSISGGASRTAKVVSKEDLDNARNDLINSAKEKAKEKLAEKVEQGQKADAGALYQEEVVFSSDKSEGQEADDFTAEVEVSFFTMSFDETDLKLLGKKIIEAGDEKENARVEITRYSLSDAKPLENRIELSSNVVYTLRSKVNTEEIRKKLMAVSLEEARDYLDDLGEVESYDLTIWPGWTGRMPIIDKRIKVEVIE